MTPAAEPREAARDAGGAPKKVLVAWAFYDWANNAFATVILTFLFSAYFSRRVAGDAVDASGLWGTMAGVAGLCIALGGPVLGAAADQGGRRKPWLAGFMLLCVSATGFLWFVKPSPAYTWTALLLVGVGMVGSDFSLIFYNAMLPELAPRDRVGRWSGWGWGMGYAGGLLCLSVALAVMGESVPSGPDADPGGLPRIRAAFLLAGAWYLVFSLPLFLVVPDTRGQGKPLARAVRDGLSQIAETLRQVRRYKGLLLFLAARMLYIDALATIFALGGIYAAGVFGMDEGQVLRFGIVLNVAAGVGALAFASLDDAMGPKTTILIALSGLGTGCAFILTVEDPALFWVAGGFIGLFVGPVQSASRSYMAHAAPERLRRQMFGLYALSGKATAFLGPLLVGGLTALSGSQRVGMSAVLVLLAAGGGLMLRVPSRSAS